LGQIFFEYFFFDDQVSDSLVELCAAWVSWEGAATVDVEEVEEFDPREEEEFER
jgi:hypothetical protein